MAKPNNGKHLDFETSFHATHHKRSFVTYKGKSFDVVKMKKYGKSKVASVGDVRVVTNLDHNLIVKNVHH